MLKKKVKKLISSIALQTIDFTHEDADRSNSSLNLHPFSPSWVPENFSVAAFSMTDAKKAVENNELKVWARFYKDTPSGSVQIRTKHVTTKFTDSFSQQLFERFPAKQALGEIKPTRVFFGKTGQSVYRGKHSNIPFNISDSKFLELGVGIYDIIWRWEYRTLASTSTDENEEWNKRWIPIESSMHRVFITVDAPKFPWTPESIFGINGVPPTASPVWTTALLIACRWSEGSKTIKEAGIRIADALFNSGKFIYHPDSHYSKDLADQEILFYLSKVLERVVGGNGLGEKINCVDCSLIVTSLVNALGGNLQIGKLQNTPDTNYGDPDIILKNRFEISEIEAVGKNAESTMADLESDGRHYFSFHSIAWQPANAETPEFNDPENIVYDACVAFRNQDEADTQTASGIPLGDNAQGYRAQLSANTNEGIEACRPQNATVRAIRVV